MIKSIEIKNFKAINILMLLLVVMVQVKAICWKSLETFQAARLDQGVAIL